MKSVRFRYQILNLGLIIVLALTGLSFGAPTPAQATSEGVSSLFESESSPDGSSGLMNGPPTVNGLFYGDGDDIYYTLLSTSYFGSKLYAYYDAPSNRLYVALVVDRSINDNVFRGGDTGTGYMTSAGWGGGGGQQRNAVKLTDSEFAGFTFACEVGDPLRTWAWQQAYGCAPSSASNPWASRADCGPGSGTPPPSYQSSSSFVWNINNYRDKYGTTAPPSGSPPWNMYTYGAATSAWKSPFASANPNTVIGLAGYPAATNANDLSQGPPITFSNVHEWEWSMVYEWSINLGPGGANCGANPIYLVTGLSHHSPLKEGTGSAMAKYGQYQMEEWCGEENDCFPPTGGGENPNPFSDWGDLPDTYGTTSANNGARHYLKVNAPYLGQDIQSEPDGQPTTNALGDGNEEDGIIIDLTGQAITAFVSNGPALLGGWFDWNNDGDFNDAGEFFSWNNVASGSNTLPFTIGTGFNFQTATQLYARFRIFSNASAAPGGSLEQADYRGMATNGEAEDYHIKPTSTIGNRVWLDENSDGYQDAGEPDIPNVQVNLYDAAGTLVATTYTDLNGGYRFTNLWPGTYYVDVLDGTDGQADTLPFANMTQTPPSTLAGADLGNQAHTASIPATSFTGYSLTVRNGDENLTADFGYNYVSAANVNGGAGVGAIGDRVWIDADGDGFQDAGEPGLAGVTMTLYYDPDGDGVFDTVFATALTDVNGNYMFNNLPVDAYMVGASAPSGYVQTGDPDLPGVVCGSGCDNLTTTPVLLAPGDVCLNADFGYQPPASQNNSVGDRTWFDADADGVQDTGEPGIPGVTVSLIRDTNGNSTWDPGEPIVGSTITGADGAYLFGGVSDGNYLMWVSDKDNVLDNKTPTFDSNGGTAPTSKGAPTGLLSSSVLGLSAVALDPTSTNPAGVNNLLQDFGYTAVGQSSGNGLIGDRVWLDIDGNGVQDANEPGLEGALVELRDRSNKIIAMTYTDRNGNYAFGGLAAGTYNVVVNAPLGMTQTFDADGMGTQNRSTVTIGGAQPLINLNQDFGYRGAGTIGNLVWEDLNADGNVGAGEPGIGGVTLDLYRDRNGNGLIDSGEPLVDSSVTVSDGSYLFEGLPVDDGGGNAQFVVDVTDTAGLLNGYWHSQGTSGVDGNSQIDPYALTLTPDAPNNLTADFGYYVKPAALGDYVWLDRNNDGIQDGDEPGIRGVKVTLTVNYPGGGSATLVTYTDKDGKYSFGNLLLDEDYNLADNTAGTPTYTISFYIPPGATASPVGQGNPAQDSNGASTVAGPLSQGQTDITYDSGFYTARLDMGDLPVTYPTLFSPGPAHIVFPDANSDGQPETDGTRPAVWLGTIIDTETNGQPDVSALGDGDDEDGLFFAPGGWIAGQSSQVTIRLNSSAAATVYYGLWIDWNNDGTLETYYAGSGVTSSPLDVVVPITVPGGYAANTNVYFRLRATDQPLTSADYVSTFINGEVEDYLRKFTPTAVEMVSLEAHMRPSGLPVWAWLSAAALVTAGGWLTLRVAHKRR